MLGVSIGVLLAKYMPWADPDRWERVNWAAHLNGIVIFALPNAFFMAAVLFTMAVLADNEIIFRLLRPSYSYRLWCCPGLSSARHST